MNRIYFLAWPEDEYDYDVTRTAVVIAKDEATARQMMYDHEHDTDSLFADRYAKHWVNRDFVTCRDIGYSKHDPEIVLTEAHEG